MLSFAVIFLFFVFTIAVFAFPCDFFLEADHDGRPVLSTFSDSELETSSNVFGFRKKKASSCVASVYL